MESLGAKLTALSSPDLRISALEQTLLNLLEKIPEPALHSRPMAKDILEANGMIRAGELARKHGIHARRMERLFREEIGVSAKVLARIVRFNHAKRTIEQKPDIDLLWLAHECGYADQSHFTRNFREMFGTTPSLFKSKVKETRRRFEEQRPDVVFIQDTAGQDE